jgi:hypothetical protein
MDIANEKMGPCPVCLGIIKPCKCQVQNKLDRLQADLRKLVEEMETHWRTGGLTPTRKNDLWFWWQKAKQLLQRGE